jgi:hypothetical protein
MHRDTKCLRRTKIIEPISKCLHRTKIIKPREIPRRLQKSTYHAHLPAPLWQMFITEETLSCSKAGHVSHLPCYVCSRAVNPRVQSSGVHVAERGRKLFPCRSVESRWGRRVVWMIGEGWKWHAQLANAPTESAAVLTARKQVAPNGRPQLTCTCISVTSGGAGPTWWWRQILVQLRFVASIAGVSFLFVHGCAAILVVLLIHQHTWQRHVGPMYWTIERFTEMD